MQKRHGLTKLHSITESVQLGEIVKLTEILTLDKTHKVAEFFNCEIAEMVKKIKISAISKICSTRQNAQAR